MGSTSRYRRRAAGSISDHLLWLVCPSWTTTRPRYEQHCPDPTPTPGLLSRTFWSAGIHLPGPRITRRRRSCVAFSGPTTTGHVDLEDGLTPIARRAQQPPVTPDW